jgi:DNA topoisomerase III
MMERNQIGTDATIHEHIETIQNRKYAFKQGSSFKPTNLGASLIVTYKALGLQLEDCHIRRMIEQRMDRIAEGELERNRAAIDTLAEVGPLYEKLSEMERSWLENMRKAMEEHK